MPARYHQRNHYPPPPAFADLVTAFRADGVRAATTHRFGGTVVNLTLKSDITSPQGATGWVILTACIWSGGADVTIDAAWLTTQAEALGLVEVREHMTPLGVAVAGRIPAEEAA